MNKINFFSVLSTIFCCVLVAEQKDYDINQIQTKLRKIGWEKTQRESDLERILAEGFEQSSGKIKIRNFHAIGQCCWAMPLDLMRYLLENLERESDGLLERFPEETEASLEWSIDNVIRDMNNDAPSCRHFLLFLNTQMIILAKRRELRKLEKKPALDKLRQELHQLTK